MSEDRKPETGEAGVTEAAAGKAECTMTFDGQENQEVKLPFHTPTLLREAEKHKPEEHVVLKIRTPDGNEKTAYDGTVEGARKAISLSVIPQSALADEFKKFVSYIMEHSDTMAVSCALVSSSDAGDEGFGFCMTARDCTAGQAAALVNCSEANVDAFADRVKIDIPGRTRRGQVVVPTKEQVESLG